MDIEQTVLEARKSLELAEHYSFGELFASVQRQRQRVMRVGTLSSLDTGDGLCAVWLNAEDSDLILHVPSESVLHRQQFLLHELAHMLLGHCDGDETSSEDALLSSIPPGLRVRMLARKSLDSDDEIAAEMLADRFAAGIRGSAFVESSFSEIFG